MKHLYKIPPIESNEIKEILSDECLEFIVELHMLFNSKRLHLLYERTKIQKTIRTFHFQDFG